MTPSATRTVYLDCDTGVDDSLALAYLLADPATDLVGIGTVSGNCSAAQGARNTLDLLALAGRGTIPVAVGAHDPLAHPYDGGVPHIHGANGVGNVELPTADIEPRGGSAAELLIALSHEHAGELSIVTIGPMTNIALALRLDPTLPTRVKDLTIMGGAALVAGNVTPVAEANIWNDPEAASESIAADWDVTLVPLDITLENVLEESHREALENAGHPFVSALGRILDFYFDFYVDFYGRRASALHDPLATAIAVGGITPTNAPRVNVIVDTTDGPGRGQTICDLRGQRLGPVDQPGANCRVVLATDKPLAPLLVQSLLDYPATVDAS
ncbi:nucleoside hydrolase [Arthrobacter sp. ERGS1:01]|uniref:nucleoside hydrolase n=1 Tax=Arthrobacter sp. ERGS1:01 TaxID=1704044 RepID=UPI0006B3FE61|nr:nucleoside hydrolase [Arthrobacter sp. ERGS1:01]ALE06550.1 nucleoside hydrolase [Arthrobacter sp. ERGS1:01]